MVKGLHQTKKGGFERNSSNPTGSATEVSCKIYNEIAKTSYINLAKFLARFWQDHARQSRQEIAKMLQDSCQVSCKILARSCKAVQTRNCQDVLQDSCKILARSCKAVQTRNCQDVLQDSCKILARSCKAVQTRNCQDVLQDSCQVSCKIKARILQILERFCTCNDIHNSRIHSTFSTLSQTSIFKVIRTKPHFSFKILQEHVRNLHHFCFYYAKLCII